VRTEKKREDHGPRVADVRKGGRSPHSPYFRRTAGRRVAEVLRRQEANIAGKGSKRGGRVRVPSLACVGGHARRKQREDVRGRANYMGRQIKKKGGLKEFFLDRIIVARRREKSHRGHRRDERVLERGMLNKRGGLIGTSNCAIVSKAVA